jgi:hypothetical protein
MKQKDLAVIGAALVAAIILSFVIDKYAFSNSASQNTQVDVVPAIHDSFPTPSTQYFNSQAIDPTQIININPNNSQQPFNNNQ